MEYPWTSASVMGAPFRLVVKATTVKEQQEGYGVCQTHDDIDMGRYLSTNASISSKEFAELYADTGREFVWAPYNCKVPHRTAQEAISALPMANHFVFMGDSTTRGPFCAKVYMGVHGTVEGGVCDYLTEEGNKRYWDGTNMKMQWGHKFTHKVFEMGDSERN